MSELGTERLDALERRVARLELRLAVLHGSSARRVLELLRDFYASPFNDGTLRIPTTTIGRILGIPLPELGKALEDLLAAGYIECKRDAKAKSGPDSMYWRISDEGRRAL